MTILNDIKDSFVPIITSKMLIYYRDMFYFWLFICHVFIEY